jgi:hypothetical protein
MPQPPKRGLLWRWQLFALAAAALLAGCANGDFKEIHPSLVSDDMHDWVAHEAIEGQPAQLSHYKLTDDERALRDLAYPLIEPPYDRHQWYSVAGEYGLLEFFRGRGFDRDAYWHRLTGPYYRSPASRYARLSDDIRNDATRLPQFFETAARVRDMDTRRRKSLAFVSALTPPERKNALRRIHENAAIVSLVGDKLAERVAGYRYALERLVIATPSPQAAGVEHDLNRLQAEIAYYRTHGVRSWVREQSLASMR